MNQSVRYLCGYKAALTAKKRQMEEKGKKDELLLDISDVIILRNTQTLSELSHLIASSGIHTAPDM